MRASGWMHVAVMGGWEQIFASQLRAVESSGVLDVTDRVRVCVAGTPPGGYRFPDFVEIVSEGQPVEPGENPTLNRLTEWAKENPGGAVWYMHTKGATRPPGPTPVYWWRRYMEHHLLTRWRDCLDALRTHECCGVEWVGPETPSFFGGIPKPRERDAGYLGNFWWARAGYLAALPTIPEDADRFAAEFAYLSSGGPKSKCFHFSGVNLYESAYRPHRYRAATLDRA